MNHSLPSIEKFDGHYRDKQLPQIREMFLRTHAIASSLLAAQELAKSPPKPPTPFKWDPTERPKDAPPSFVITRGACYWRWNCGWQQYNPTTGKYFGPVIGHRAFRRKPVCHQKDRDWVSKPRPYGPWRRVVKSRMNHFIYGNVDVIETDGVIAVIQVDAGFRDCVSFHALTEIHTPLPPKVNPNKKTATKKSPKPKGLSRDDLLDLL